LTIGYVRAGSNVICQIAGLTRRGAAIVAANAIDAETAEAFGIGCAALSNFLLADAVAVAGLVCPNTRRHAIGVVLTSGDVGANANGPGNVA